MRKISYALYDLANSAYSVIIITFIISAYFAKQIVGDVQLGAAYWQWTAGLCGIVVALTGPLLGSYADKIVNGKEDKFEEIWINRETHLDNVPGFLEFNLVRGKKEKDHTLYASHSKWKSKNDFMNWTRSESFRKAHKNAGKHSNIYLGHPIFEGFEVVI